MALSSTVNPDHSLTEILCVLDRSGSMQSIREDAVGGFNALLEAQQAVPGEARLTLVLFDHEYEVVLDAVPLADVRPLTAETYVPRGTTALLDALGRTIDTAYGRLASVPESERPGAILACVITDGMENASTDYTRERVKALVEARQAEGWQFQFLAANVDAFAEAGGLGIGVADTASFAATGAGTAAMFSLVSERVLSVRRR